MVFNRLAHLGVNSLNEVNLTLVQHALVKAPPVKVAGKCALQGAKRKLTPGLVPKKAPPPFEMDGFHVVSVWFPCGFHVASMWFPFELTRPRVRPFHPGLLGHGHCQEADQPKAEESQLVRDQEQQVQEHCHEASESRKQGPAMKGRLKFG